MAYEPYGWFNTSAIDSNLNQQFDLDVCFGLSHSSPVFINKAALFQEMGRWKEAQSGAFFDQDACGNDNSNILIYGVSLGPCDTTNGGTVAETEDLGDNGYSAIEIWINTQCYDDFDWEDNNGIANNKFSATATVLHEVGHALGLNHELGDPDLVMSSGGPDVCLIHSAFFPYLGIDWTLAEDDADGFRDGYPGINDRPDAFPSDAGCDE